MIVPPGALHSVPRSLLPSCRGRTVSVAPSASLWHQAILSGGGDGDPAAESGSGVVLVAGPGLPGAVAEIAALARRYPGAVRLTGAGATCEAVSDALDGARLAHVAAHGRFRADNPLFSCLELADGPFTVYDLEALEQAPRTLVLSACDSGLSDVQPGDELMGLAWAVFALGTRTLIASVLPVPDVATRRLMLDFHARIAGRAPTGGSPRQGPGACRLRRGPAAGGRECVRVLRCRLDP